MRRWDSIQYGVIDDAAARALLDRFAKLIDTELRRVSATDSDNAAMRSAACLAVLEGALTHNEHRGPLQPWIRRVVRWRLVAQTTRHGSEPELRVSDAEQVVNGDNPEQIVTKLRLHAAIGRLSPRHRTIITNYFWGGETLRQVAETLGLSPARVHAELHTALSLLRMVVDEPEEST